jgi:hypothetical protein
MDQSPGYGPDRLVYGPPGRFMGHPALLLTSEMFHGGFGHYRALRVFYRHPGGSWGTSPVYGPSGLFMDLPARLWTSWSFYVRPGRYKPWVRYRAIGP